MSNDNGYEEYDPDLGRYVWVYDYAEDEDEEPEEVEA